MEEYIDFKREIDIINRLIIYEIAKLMKKYSGYEYTFKNSTIALNLNEDYDYETIWVEKLEWDEFNQTLIIVDNYNRRYGFGDFTDKPETLKALYDALYMDIETHLPIEH